MNTISKPVTKAQSTLLEKMMNLGTVKSSSILSKSAFFNEKDTIKTDLPILNLAFSGKIDGGLVPGLTVFAGESKTFKSMLGLYCIKAYLDQYEDAICLYYDSEFGTSAKYFDNIGVDSSRVVHIPIEHIEQLKFDLVRRLDGVYNDKGKKTQEGIVRGDKVFIFVDSIGNLASKKEVDDAHDESSAADMSRAKAMRSMLRIITPHLTTKDIPCIMINHIYTTMDKYAKPVMGGGTAVMYAANQCFIISKYIDYDGTGTDKKITGKTFKINVVKSRFVKENSSFSFSVKVDKGINVYSGIFDEAVDLGFIKATGGWYQIPDFATGSFIDKKIRRSDINKQFMDSLLEYTPFKEALTNKYQYSNLVLEEDIVEDVE